MTDQAHGKSTRDTDVVEILRALRDASDGWSGDAVCINADAGEAAAQLIERLLATRPVPAPVGLEKARSLIKQLIGYADGHGLSEKYAGDLRDLKKEAWDFVDTALSSTDGRSSAGDRRSVTDLTAPELDQLAREAFKEAAEQAAAAWVAFAGNGNIRFWTADPVRAAAEKERGMDLRAFTLAELVALAAKSHIAGQIDTWQAGFAAGIERAAQYHDQAARDCKAIAAVNQDNELGPDSETHAIDHEIAADDIRELAPTPAQTGILRDRLTRAMQSCTDIVVQNDLRSIIASLSSPVATAADIAKVMWEADHEGGWDAWGDGQDASRDIYLANAGSVLQHFNVTSRIPADSDRSGA